jgi:hypothetical protein
MLDGLDECNERQQKQMESLIEQFTRSTIKVFVTSRPHIHILNGLFTPESICPIKADDSDMLNYLEVTLAKAGLTLSVGPRIIEQLKDGAKGM